MLLCNGGFEPDRLKLRLLRLDILNDMDTEVTKAERGQDASRQLLRLELSSLFVLEDRIAWLRHREALDRLPAPNTPLGVYLHIPFCRKRCRFCYFKVYTEKDANEIENYLNAAIRELDLYSQGAFHRRTQADLHLFWWRHAVLHFLAPTLRADWPDEGTAALG